MSEGSIYQVRLSSGLNIVTALWLIISPYGFGFNLNPEPFWNSVLVGAAVAFLAILRLATPFRFPEISWLNCVLGIWLIVSPWILGFAEIEAAFGNSVATGLVIMFLAVWSYLAGKSGQRLRTGD